MTMKYNIALSNLLRTVPGTKILTEQELLSLTNSNTGSSLVTVSGTEQLSIVLDLKARYNLDDLFYYRQEAALEEVVVLAKQNDADVWTTLNTTSSGNVVASSLRETYNRYQFLNIIHTVSSGVATPLEVQVITSDSEVRFGSVPEGDVLAYPLSSGDSENTPQEVFIKNVDGTAHDFFILIDDDGTGSPIEVSTLEAGPYVPLRGNAEYIPGTHPWSSGVFVNTEVDGSDRVVISTSVSGTYYSPVLDITSLQARRVFWDSTLSGTSSVDNILDIESQPTIGVRLSSVSPQSPWVSGQSSNDANWSTVSGSLQFSEVANNTILPLDHKGYIQFRIEMHGDADFPKINSVGVEYPLSVTIQGNETESIFVKSIGDAKTGSAELLTWYFESRPLLN